MRGHRLCVALRLRSGTKFAVTWWPPGSGPHALVLDSACNEVCGWWSIDREGRYDRAAANRRRQRPPGQAPVAVPSLVASARPAAPPPVAPKPTGRSAQSHQKDGVILAKRGEPPASTPATHELERDASWHG